MRSMKHKAAQDPNKTELRFVLRRTKRIRKTKRDYIPYVPPSDDQDQQAGKQSD